MAKDNATRQREKRAKQKQRLELLGEKVINLPLPASTAKCLEELMHQHGFTDQREAIATMIHRLHEAGSEAATPFLIVPRHKITISEKVSQAFERESRREGMREEG
ncbi:hypothetical protein ACIGCM_03775 [Pseudomonas sp. NPDC078700]|uniref:hypothetical protein n=1 Tax=Pseudomonas sp. NPDC078700 TaxID=3364424 RepID=UPI0037CB1C86